MGRVEVIAQWELMKYQQAAEAMCFRIGEYPHDTMMDEDGQPFQRWMINAKRMAEHVIMLEEMRNFGLAP